MEKLTKLQAKVFSYLKSYTLDRGYPPTLREIRDGLGLSSHSSIQNALAAVEKKGYIRRSGKARAIEFTAPPTASRPAVLPLAGRIRAGAPYPAVEDVQDYVAVDRSLVAGDDNFLLEVEGDSMIGAHIMDGDYVVVKPQPAANNGEIVAALIDDEATVKKFYREKGRIRLQPANPHYAPIFIEPDNPDVFIIGRVISVIRHIEKRFS